MPPRSQEVDYPEEILLDSVAELRRVASWKPYAFLISVGVVSWTLMALVFLASFSPLMWLILLMGIADPMLISAFFREFGVPFPVLVAILMGAPVVGAGLGAATVPVGLWGVARIRPRTFLSEEAFRAAVARRFSVAAIAPHVVVIVLLGVLSPIPTVSAWDALSFNVIAALAEMIVIAAATFWTVQSIFRQMNVLRLPAVSELTIRAQQAPNPQERARLWGILFAQDRRHLPRNTTVVGPRFLVTSVGVILSHHWWVLVVLAALCGPLLWFVDMIQAFLGMSVGFDPTAADPQGRPDVSLAELGAMILAAVAWVLTFAFAPVLTIIAVRVRGREPRDLRTLPTVRERLEVNPWEKTVVWVGTVLVVCAEVLIIAGYFVLIALVGQWTALHWLWLLVWSALVVPLSAVATWRALAVDLRTIVYGPAHWFARRATPTAAIAPLRGTKASVAKDPRVAERRARERAAGLGLAENATPEELARAASSRGALPDLGVEDDPYEPWTPGEPERTSEHSIPKGLDELRGL